MRIQLLLGAALALAVSVPTMADERSVVELREQVSQAERAFARSMADRDHVAFASFLSDEAVFLSGQTTLRGKQAVAEGWKPFFEGPQAPFSWEPEHVEPLDSGSLAVSTGPVRDPQGNRVGTYISTWRKGPDGSWKVVLDGGCPPCECK